MSNYHVSLRFRRLANAPLATFAGNVIERLTGNPAFPNPPVTLAEVTDRLARFRAALAAATGGGLMLTAIKNEALASLLSGLYQLANYVRGLASNDLAMLLSSGFDAASKNRAQSALGQPVVLAIQNVMSGALWVRVGPLKNARGYQAQVRSGDGPCLEGGISP